MHRARHLDFEQMWHSPAQFVRTPVQLVDHWGIPGGKLEDHLVRPGLPVQGTGAAAEPLPAWKR